MDTLGDSSTSVIFANIEDILLTNTVSWAVHRVLVSTDHS